MEKTIRFKNGDQYKGEVNSEGQPHGTGHMDYKLNGYYGQYDGEWENGERSGKGRYYKFSKGGGARHSYEYEGEWLHDMEHGQGVATQSDEIGIHLSTMTEKYTGGFKEGKRHGHGAVVEDNFDGSFANGKNRFEGEFHEGRTIGHGIWEYANGDRFEGEFADYFNKHGRGEYTFKNGLSFKASWKDGSLQPETIEPCSSEKMPFLLVTEKHYGFDYNKSACFLIPVKEKSMAIYADAATIYKDSSFDAENNGLGILDFTEDSVTFEVRGVFTKDGKPVEATVHRGETVLFEDEHNATATIYDEDYDYTTGDSLKVTCR